MRSWAVKRLHADLDISRRETHVLPLDRFGAVSPVEGDRKTVCRAAAVSGTPVYWQMFSHSARVTSTVYGFFDLMMVSTT